MVQDITNDPKGSTTLRILTANLSFHNKKASAVNRAVLEPEPDVIVLLEWTGENFDGEESGKQGYRALINAPQPCLPDNPKNGAYGVGVFVRVRLSGIGCVVPSPVQGPCPLPLGLARIRFRERDITVVGLHAPAPISEWTTKPTIRKVMELIRDGKLREDLGAGKEGDWVILTGDFNVPSFDPILREVRKGGLKDVYSERNHKPGPTWSPFQFLPDLLMHYVATWGSRHFQEILWNEFHTLKKLPWQQIADALENILERLPPFLRLDFIFCPKEFNVVKSWTVKIPGSDHRAVVADLVIPISPR